MEQDTSGLQNNRKTSNLVYLLMFIIAVLIGTNIYVFLNKNEKEQQYVVQASHAKDEKETLTAELDKLESDLSTATNSNKKLTNDLQAKDEELKGKINELKSAIRSRKLTKAELQGARAQIANLKNSVQQFGKEIASLKEENKTLTTENTTLKTTVDSVNKKTTELRSQNEVLSKKVSVASALKTSELEAVPIKVKSNGKESEVRSAKKVNKIRVNFTLAENELNQEGSHQIFLQVLNPEGKIEGGTTAGTFHSSNGSDMSFTTHTTINFLKANRNYSLEWKKADAFTPGDYKVVLWGDGFKMGESAFNLRKGGLF